MQITVGRVLSLLVAAAYVFAVCHWGTPGAWRPMIGLIIPLALIWFPDEIGDLTGYYKTGYVNTQTPGVIVSVIGWFILVGLPVVLWLVMRRRAS